MNTQKTNSYAKLLVFFLVAIILVFAFGFVADGWQSEDNENENSGNTDGDNTDSGNTDEDKDEDKTQGDEPEAPEIPTPEFVNRLTGLETTEELANKIPTAFVINSTSALYGISSADMLVEIPTENGDTRFLLFATDTASLGKIGSICPTRAYISALSKNFGAVLVSHGSDDRKAYASPDISHSHFDLTSYTGYHYTEYNKFVYSNGDLISTGLANSSIGKTGAIGGILPFYFNDFDAEIISGQDSAREVMIPYSSSGATELKYSELDGHYTASKGGTAIHDMLNDKTPKFANVIILFADSVTYETKEGAHSVMETVGGGEGYYITGGTRISVSWQATEGGELSLYTADGERLTVNRGTSYIGFFKSSEAARVEIR